MKKKMSNKKTKKMAKRIKRIINGIAGKSTNKMRKDYDS